MSDRLIGLAGLKLLHHRIPFRQRTLRKVDADIHGSRHIGVEVRHRRFHPLPGVKLILQARLWSRLPGWLNGVIMKRGRSLVASGRNSRFTPSLPEKLVKVPHS